MSTSIQEAAEKRGAAASAPGSAQRSAGGGVPDGVDRRRSAPMPCEMRAAEVKRDGKTFLRLTGMASTYEQGYEMWDWAGPYTEVVSEGAGSESLSRSPDVVFLLNHTGIPFARTGSGTLDLSEPGGGLLSEAYLNPKRQDVQDLVASVEDGSSTEMSFAFRIKQGSWSPDYTEYRIGEYDLERGDTSVVTFGANPNTSIEARAAQFELRNEVMRFLAGAHGPALAAAREVLVDQVASQVGTRAAEELRHLRACVEQGSLGAVERTSVVAVLQRAAEGTLTQALAGDGSLGVLLGVSTPAAPAPAPAAAAAGSFVPTSVGFMAELMGAARELPPVS